MRTTRVLRPLLGLALMASVASGLAACEETNHPAATGGAEATAATVAAVVTAAPTATAVVTAAPTAAPVESAAPEPTAAKVAPTAAPAAASAAAPATTGSAAAGQAFDCGAKGQKACPMQGWMKSVMGNAAASGDADKIASALATIASKPPPGMGNWVAIASQGVAKAKAGDIDGAKVSCKVCHDQYKATYVKTMRDRPW